MRGAENEKGAIRQLIKNRKAKLSTMLRCRQAQQVFEHLEQQPYFIKASHVLCYWSLPDELATHDFVNKWYQDKNIYLPKVVGRDLHVHPYTGQASLQKGAFGIEEPTTAPLQSLELVDLVIVPGMAFSVSGRRMGRGGGYYDRLLPRLKNACKVGVCFDFQLLDYVPCEKHDIKMDDVITVRP